MKLFHFFVSVIFGERERHGEVEQTNVQRRRRNKSFIGFKSENATGNWCHSHLCVLLYIEKWAHFACSNRAPFRGRWTTFVCIQANTENMSVFKSRACSHTHIHIRNINHFERLSVTCRVRSIQFNKRRKSHTIRLKTKTERTNKKNECDGREIIKRRVKVLSAKRRRRTGEKSKKFYQ